MNGFRLFFLGTVPPMLVFGALGSSSWGLTRFWVPIAAFILLLEIHKLRQEIKVLKDKIDQQSA